MHLQFLTTRFFLSREHNFLGPFLHACNFCRQLTNFFGRSARWPLVFAFSTICTNHMIDAYSFHGFGKNTYIWDILTFCNVFFYLPSRIRGGGIREAKNINVPSLFIFSVRFPWAWNGLNGFFVSHPPKLILHFFIPKYKYLESLSKNRQESDRWSGDESTSTQPFPLVVEANGLAVDGTISMVHCHHLLLLVVLVLTNACIFQL